MGHAARAKAPPRVFHGARGGRRAVQGHMAYALKVQRARQAAEQFAAAAEGVRAWLKISTSSRYDDKWIRLDTWFPALSATTYGLLIVASRSLRREASHLSGVQIHDGRGQRPSARAVCRDDRPWLFSRRRPRRR